MHQPVTENRAIAMRILQWIACAKRPLAKHEVQNGIALHAGNLMLDDGSRLSEHVFELCKPLIEEVQGRCVVFIHFSVKEDVEPSE